MWKMLFCNVVDVPFQQFEGVTLLRVRRK